MKHKEFKSTVERIWKQKMGNDPMSGIWLKLQKLKEKWRIIEEKILRQKARVNWIDHGNSNSKYFYAQLKIRANKNTITSVYNELGVKITDPKAVEKEFTCFFKQLMGKATGLKPCPNTKFIKEGECPSMQQQQDLIQDITYAEINEAVKDMPNDKAPWSGWIPNRILHKTLAGSKMKQAWNCTTITLIPKVPAPTIVKDYMPIVCCTTVYKISAKILTKRIKKVIELIIGKAQSAFIERRSIVDNILFSHELFNDYNRKDLSPRCVLKEAFNGVSPTSGLQANAKKSSIYITGIAQHIKEQLMKLTGYADGSLPFKYMGVPLSTRKLNIHQCLPLVEKITKRVRCWSARLLSYSGRIQLIKYVLFGIQTYWVQIFLLPKKIMKMIETICRTFLWTGSIECSKKALIAWDTLCQPKATGGLNVIYMKIWNKATLLKHLWVLAMKKDTLWIKWAHNYYIKNRDIAEMDTPKAVAWVIRKIIEAREDVKQMRPGQNSLISTLETLVKQGKFQIHRAYVQMQPQFPKVMWKSIHLHINIHPRFKFHLWLAIHQRLATVDKLMKFGIQAPLECVFCATNMEVFEHLYFGCPKTHKL
ncbi:uncharacterized protein [Nicotiana sylvestris]|uniref:uncharacterized protein n=1 Tax=Nicotiana sylvestris TaxID=4096 RepID=UPI00388C5AA8